MKKQKYFGSRLRAALASMAMVAGVNLTTAIPADAYDFNWGDWEGTLYTQVSYSIGLRARSPRPLEEINAGLVGGKGLLYQTQRDYVFDNAGDIYTSVFKISPELTLQKDNYGFFGRATLFYDPVYYNTNPNFSEFLLNQGNDDWTDDTKDLQGLGIDLYDAYGFVDFEVDDFLGMGYAPINLRFGNLSYNWGEGSFYLDAINTTNALDVNKLMSPGLEMKEAALQVPSVSVQLGLFDTLSLEAFTHLGWRKHRFPAAGTFFHTDDDVLGPGHDGIYYDVGGFLSPDLASYMPGPMRIVRKTKKDADNLGQWGLSARYDIEQAGIEVGAYFLNYHHQEPYFRFNPASGAFVGDGQIEFVYPEDQKLLGLSAAGQIGNWAVAGEVVYQPNHPVLAGDPLGIAFDNFLGAPVTLDGVTYDSSTQSFDGFVEEDIYHGSVNLLRAFGPALGFDSTFLIVAAAVDHLPGATGEPGGEDAAGNPIYTFQGNGNGNAPTDKWAWGYNLEIDFTKLNAFGVGGLTVTPGFGWQHAVSGYSRFWGNWWQGKKWFQARLKANYKDVDYTLSYVGIRHADEFEAADYEEYGDNISFTISYKF